MKEPFEQRLFRIFAQAGYSPVQLLTVTPEEMVEIPGITAPTSGRCCASRTRCWPTATKSAAADWWRSF